MGGFKAGDVMRKAKGDRVPLVGGRGKLSSVFIPLECGHGIVRDRSRTYSVSFVCPQCTSAAAERETARQIVAAPRPAVQEESWVRGLFAAHSTRLNKAEREIIALRADIVALREQLDRALYLLGRQTEERDRNGAQSGAVG